MPDVDSTPDHGLPHVYFRLTRVHCHVVGDPETWWQSSSHWCGARVCLGHHLAKWNMIKFNLYEGETNIDDISVKLVCL